jgi:hypothetical protein
MGSKLLMNVHFPINHSVQVERELRRLAKTSRGQTLRFFQVETVVVVIRSARFSNSYFFFAQELSMHFPPLFRRYHGPEYVRRA